MRLHCARYSIVQYDSVVNLPDSICRDSTKSTLDLKEDASQAEGGGGVYTHTQSRNDTTVL